MLKSIIMEIIARKVAVINERVLKKLLLTSFTKYPQIRNATIVIDPIRYDQPPNKEFAGLIENSVEIPSNSINTIVK
jgi:hypothetical protein